MSRLIPEIFTYNKYGLHTRLVVESDTEFIVKLRTNPKLERYIHSTSPDLKLQREWIRNYKTREEEGLDYYFIFYSNEQPVGLYRIYGIHDTTFTIGSWVFDPEAPLECSVAASVIIREIAFEVMNLSFEDGYDGVHVDNKQVIKFNKMIGLKEYRRIKDVKGEYISMSMTKEDFEKNKPKVLHLIGY